MELNGEGELGHEEREEMLGFVRVEEIACLYHPRNQVWEQHFLFQVDMQIEGLTPIGRIAVRVLQMNDPDRVENRQILAEMGDYPCLEK